MAFEDVFSEGPYRFQMRFMRGSIPAFYARTANHESLISERARLLGKAPQLYCATLPESGEVLAEAVELAGIAASGDPFEVCKTLGQHWEPDFLLLAPEGDGKIKFVAGCVCFPSSWDVREKIGQPVSQIHAVVPGLNNAIGAQIDGFLSRIRPDTSWERLNWGLSRSPELNQHPSRKLPRLDPPVALEEVWLRIEYQSLAALPRTGGVLFGIRLRVHKLAEVKADPQARSALVNALKTMPEEVAGYKGIAPAREGLLELLSS